MHLDEERVQRLIDGELSRPAEASAREHLATCAECRARVDAAKREQAEVEALLRAVDDPPPGVDADAIAATAEARARARRAGRLRWAAGVVLALCVGGAAYAVPGSPLPALVQAVVVWIGGGEAPAPPAPAPIETAEPRVAGISVAPGDALAILFTSRQADGRVRVSLADGPEVVVRAPLGAATFSSDADRLVIDNAGPSATFEIEIPRAAPRVEIQVAGERIFLKDGERVTGAAGGTMDAPGPHVLPLAP